ncbi:hypothetical protein MRX96_016901 [Rhipicephalus microplus]
MEVRIARGKPGLTANAVPTFLPDLPAYPSTSVKKPRPERKRCLVSTSGSAKKVRLSRRDEHEASLLGEENSDPNTSPAENMQANPLKSGDLRDLATCLSVSRLWTKLTPPDLDLLVYATTRTTKQPFSVSHEKVICFSLDSNSDVVASCYLGAREKKYGEITSLLEATNIFQEVDTALLCSSALSKDAYDGLAQNLTEKMKRTLTPASDGVFSKNCLGMVTVKEPGILTALLGADAASGDDRTKQFLLDQLIADRDLCSAELALNSIEKAAPDHVACVSAKSDERLIFYVAGYVARKFLAKTSCDACKNVLLADKNDIKNLQAAQLTQLKDYGGLLYPSGFLFRFLKNLENLFTGCFSAQELHHESTMDVIWLIKSRPQHRVGCTDHAEMLTAKMVAFFITTRLHFFVKSLNRARMQKRETAKYLKLSRCT